MAIYTGVVGDNRLAGGVWFRGYFNAGAEPNDAPEPNEIACCRADFHRYVNAGVASYCYSDTCTAYAHAGKLFIQQIL